MHFDRLRRWQRFSLEISHIVSWCRSNTCRDGALRLRWQWQVLRLATCLLFISSCSSASTPAPPAETSKKAEAVIAYFCDAWKTGDYDAMYGALSDTRQDSTSLVEWKKAWKNETRLRGLLDSYKVTGPETDEGNRSLWSIEVTYRNKTVGTLTKKTWMREGEKGWRVDEGGLGPASSALPTPK